MDKQCKDILRDSKLVWTDDERAVETAESGLKKGDSVSVQEYEREWSEIFDGVSDVAGACPFQDGQIDYAKLEEFFEVNKRTADKCDMLCRASAKTIDRDMPSSFCPLNS